MITEIDKGVWMQFDCFFLSTMKRSRDGKVWICQNNGTKDYVILSIKLSGGKKCDSGKQIYSTTTYIISISLPIARFSFFETSKRKDISFFMRL